VCLNEVEQPRVNPLRCGFRNTVNRMGFLSPHTDLNNAWIILDQLAHGLPAQTPRTGEIADAIVFLKSGVFG
jgi:hypothetical protein